MPEGFACRIILARHGETEANRLKCFAASDDIQLTSRGRQQALDLAHTIREAFDPVRIYASHFTRARQTAEIVGQELGLTVSLLPGIEERNFGSLRGRPYHEMGEMMRTSGDYDPDRRWLWAPEGGESLEQVRVRAMRSLNAAAVDCSGQDIVVVSHGAVMECVAAELAGDWATASVPENGTFLVIRIP